MEQEQQYKEMLSKEQQHLYGANERRRKNSDGDGMWKKIEDGSGYGIYTTFIEDERSSIVCTSCGMSIAKDRAMYVRELNQYWHETCFRCVLGYVDDKRDISSYTKVTILAPLICSPRAQPA
ncbi:hypothetical protein QZH41_003280 [Actinostola sp. cb2023]|nr:hypothetical protein QZH41_003280 [Actinostola sp. cb2023]